MPAYRMGSALAVLAVFCVLAIFFFPAAQGPYPVVHGPVTALLSIRAAATLRWKIVRSGLSALKGRLHQVNGALALFVVAMFTATEFRLDSLAAGCSSILRC